MITKQTLANYLCQLIEEIMTEEDTKETIANICLYLRICVQEDGTIRRLDRNGNLMSLENSYFKEEDFHERLVE